MARPCLAGTRFGFEQTPAEHRKLQSSKILTNHEVGTLRNRHGYFDEANSGTPAGMRLVSGQTAEIICANVSL